MLQRGWMHHFQAWWDDHHGLVFVTVLVGDSAKPGIFTRVFKCGT